MNERKSLDCHLQMKEWMNCLTVYTSETELELRLWHVVNPTDVPSFLYSFVKLELFLFT